MSSLHVQRFQYFVSPSPAHNVAGLSLLSVVWQALWHKNLQGNRWSCHALSSLCPSQPERCFQRQLCSHLRAGDIPSLLCLSPSHAPKSALHLLLAQTFLRRFWKPQWYSWKNDLKGVFCIFEFVLFRYRLYPKLWIYSPKKNVLLSIFYMSVEFHVIFFSILGMMKCMGLCGGLKQS